MNPTSATGSRMIRGKKSRDLSGPRACDDEQHCDARLHRHQRHFVGPRAGGFQLAGQAEQNVFAAERRAQLDADRDAGLAPIQRQRKRRAAGNVIKRREWDLPVERSEERRVGKECRL